MDETMNFSFELPKGMSLIALVVQIIRHSGIDLAKAKAEFNKAIEETVRRDRINEQRAIDKSLD